MQDEIFRHLSTSVNPHHQKSSYCNDSTLDADSRVCRQEANERPNKRQHKDFRQTPARIVVNITFHVLGNGFSDAKDSPTASAARRENLPQCRCVVLQFLPRFPSFIVFLRFFKCISVFERRLFEQHLYTLSFIH